MQKATRVINHNITEPWWGLRRNIKAHMLVKAIQLVQA